MYGVVMRFWFPGWPSLAGSTSICSSFSCKHKPIAVMENSHKQDKEELERSPWHAIANPHTSH